MIDKNIGKRYGMLTIVKLAYRDRYYYKHYICQCDCGKSKIVSIHNLKSGATKSCGCLYVKSNQKNFCKKNIYYEKDGYMVGITNNTNKEFFFDKEDLEKVKKYCWHETNRGYIANKSKKLILLHRLVTNAPQGMVVDHINHNRIDDRKDNLRICTQKENMQNLLKTPKGISRIKRGKNVYYVLQLKGKYRGCYTNKQDAEIEKQKILKSYL